MLCSCEVSYKIGSAKFTEYSCMTYDVQKKKGKFVAGNLINLISAPGMTRTHLEILAQYLKRK